MEAYFDNRFERYEEASSFMKAIAHPVRICIIMGLSRKKLCNVTDMKCQLDLPQSTVSTHLAVLREHGILEPVRQGTEIYYRLKDNRAVDMLRGLGITG